MKNLHKVEWGFVFFAVAPIVLLIIATTGNNLMHQDFSTLSGFLKAIVVTLFAASTAAQVIGPKRDYPVRWFCAGVVMMIVAVLIITCLAAWRP